MNFKTLTTSSIAALILTGCIAVDSDKVGVEYDHNGDAAKALANTNATALAAVAGNNEGRSYTGGFDPLKAKYFSSKGTTAGLSGVDIQAKVTAIANGVSRIKNGSKFDRVQNHPVTVGLDMKVNLPLSSLDNPENATINTANLVLKGAFGTTNVAAFKNYESDPDGKIKDKKVDALKASDLLAGDLSVVISDNGLKTYATDLLTPKQPIPNKDLYGIYRNGTQYTAFFASSNSATDATTISNNSNDTYDINYRGIANWSGAESNLNGNGHLSVNFLTGKYDGEIDVKKGTTGYGKVIFSGTSNNKVTFNDKAATFTKSGGTAIKGYVQGNAYGDKAATFLGTTDFADGANVLVGSFKATHK